MNYIKVARNHWKKLTFASAVSTYGVFALKSHYEITQHMRAICDDVAKISNVSNGDAPKKILVVINPVANKKKAEKSFKKYCEPILHLAGYSVDILKTNYVGHAKTFIENVKELPHAIVIAGGDGTSSEVVTGLLRRRETPCPITILPLGRKNETAYKYLGMNPKSDLDHVKAMTQAVMPLINESVKYENVIQYDVIENNSEEANNLKPIYGLNRLSWGVLKDIDSNKDKYWYFGFFRHHAAAFFKTFSNSLNWNFHTDYVYTPPCAGCSNCFIEKQKYTTNSLLSKLISKKVDNEPTRKHIKNENCNVQVEGHVDTNQVNISCNRNAEEFDQLETKFINTLEPGIEFIKNISKITNNVIEPTVTLKSRTIQLFPTSETENSSYSIDGEEYDARPIKVSIVPNAIKVFC